MKKINALLLTTLCSATICLAETPSPAQRSEEVSELNTLILKSNNTLAELKKQIPAERLNHATCVAVFPEITEAALVVGGKHGDGIATCRQTDGSWSRVGFLDLNGASLGAQIGVKSTDMVLLFNNEKAQQALSKGKVALGADLTVTSGTTDLSKSAQTSMSDVYSYSRSGGAFVGALLDGTMINADESSLKSFYGERATFGSTLSSSNIPAERTMVSDFIKSLPSRG